MSHTEKPVLYLPTRLLYVPCDYDPASRSQDTYTLVEFRHNYIRMDYVRYDTDSRRPFLPRDIEPSSKWRPG
jgi:hypothetical protein